MSTISSTVNGKVTLTCCDSIARCASQLARRVGAKIALPSVRPRRRVGRRSPESSRSSVDLPAPFGPTMATISPGVDAQVDRIEQRRAAARMHRCRPRLENRVIARPARAAAAAWRERTARRPRPSRCRSAFRPAPRCVRASVSAPTIRIAPSSTEAGSSRRCAGPITRRRRCGTTMPTKPMTPLTDTATPVIAETRTIAIRFSRSTSTPL